MPTRTPAPAHTPPRTGPGAREAEEIQTGPGVWVGSLGVPPAPGGSALQPLQTLAVAWGASGEWPQGGKAWQGGHRGRPAPASCVDGGEHRPSLAACVCCVWC